MRPGTFCPTIAAHAGCGDHQARRTGCCQCPLRRQRARAAARTGAGAGAHPGQRAQPPGPVRGPRPAGAGPELALDRGLRRLRRGRIRGGRRVVLNAALRMPELARPDAAAVSLLDMRMVGEHMPGTHAEYFLAPASNVLDVGEADPAEAAAFALVHLTAWRMLVTRAGLKPGQTVLITGIGGGVALALLGICRHMGCATIVTSRQQWKLDRALELGADHGVLDTGEDWSRQVRGLTGKRGCDICADSVGKAVHNQCIKSLARGGVFVTCGATTGADAVTDLARL